MTLARLQQTLVFLWSAALLAALILPWRAGHPWLACAAASAVLLSHAVWLALMFGLMRWQNRRDPAPPATWHDLRSAWWGEVRAAPQVFGWRQPFRSRAEPDFLPPDAFGRVGVVLVHGFVCNRGLWTPWLRQLRQARVPFVAIDLAPVFGSIDDYVPLIEAAVASVEAATGERPLVIAHSMGGLAVRAWLADQAADERVRGVITLGTPHRGTWLAKLASLGVNARQMRPGSAWLASLGAREALRGMPPPTCVYGHCDNIVFPASNAVLPGAKAVHVPATAHIDLIHHPMAVAQMWEALGREPAGRG